MTATVQQRMFDRQQLLQLADWLALGVALSLPWSTSATSIFIVCWLVAVLPTLTAELAWREVASPAGGLPILLWLVAAFGMMWAGVSWPARLGGLDAYNRLLVIPLLLAQFRRSNNGAFVLCGYLTSVSCLVVVSWVYALVPALWSHGNYYGVPVKDYIFQTDEFLICGFALLGIAGELASQGKWRPAVLLAALAAIFLGNLAFVFTSRTGLLVAPFLIAALGWRLSGVRGVITLCLGAAVLGPVLWLSSPHLRDFALNSISALHGYFSSNAVTSSGLHVEFLRKSVGIIEGAPVFGHGTGSIGEQFRRAAAGKSGAAGVVSVNPHNQIFAVAIELGLIGGAILAAMWAAHFILFRRDGWVAWIGTVVVIENVVSSAVNSHLADFSQGWLYVFGVGIAGGTLLKKEIMRPAAANRAAP